ncbi:hypothetical protein PV327_010549 [Microctonus hyperodae]|uniref:MICAL-like protein 1 n=1 Tax=Microctonus hyperodae TaxID=165561 RepID=A0AA39FS59_MICHY|nr:hypothetical protein PV327_010549 [Microctonus hyperodae]
MKYHISLFHATQLFSEWIYIIILDFASLNKDDVYGNNELAFRIAAQHLGIPALLDAEDMASCTVPDRLSILTYLSQFYQHFGGSSPSRVAVSRTPDNANKGITPVAESPPSKVISSLGMRREPCAVCGMPVFLAEKLVIGRTIYHRICFRCARCNNQLTPGNYYETEDNEYCCETCPDEEEGQSTTDNIESYVDSLAEFNEEIISDVNQSSILNYHRALSDEEKYVQQNHHNGENPTAASAALSKSTSELSQMRLNFMSSHLLDDKINNIDNFTDQSNNYTVSPDEKHYSSNDTAELKSMTILNENENCLNKFVNNIDDNTVNSIHNRCLTATTTTTNRNIDYKNNDLKTSQDTKETLGVVNKNDNDIKNKLFEEEDNVDQSLPLVKRRLKMFENLVATGVEDEIQITPSTSRNIEPDSLDVDNCEEIIDEKQPMEILTEDNEQLLEKSSAEGIINTFNSAEIDSNIEEQTDDYPDTMNPFNSDEDTRNEKENEMNSKTSESSTMKVSTNPFGSDSSENENDNGDETINSQIIPPKPAARINRNNDCIKSNHGIDVGQSPKRRLVAPQINLNPFWSDGEEPESDDDSVNKITTPIPKPRTNKSVIDSIYHLKSNLNRDGIHASNSSISSSSSTVTSGGHYRKRKPAPPPPPIVNDKSTTIITSTPDVKSTTPKQRKNKRAPLPPTLINSLQSYKLSSSDISNLSLNESPVNKEQAIINDDEERKIWEDVKVNKNEANRNKQSMKIISPSESDQDYSFHDKSVQGKWKRKKAPAPARPVPQRRKIKVMSAKDVKIELSEIEMQQQGLEKQGVRLEQLIRQKCEGGDGNDENSLNVDADELVLELFALVNEKNELFRRQAELMLLKRQQRLEEEHADVEYQIRCLMCQPEATKTDFDKQREETLIQRLVEIVERRSEIVECLEMDRRREVEEDKSINMHMEIYTAKNKVGERSSDGNQSINAVKIKKTKFKEILTEKHIKKSSKKDADKDVDETEVKLKRQNKRKWF